MSLRGSKESRGNFPVSRTNRVCSSNIPYWIEMAFRTYPVDSLSIPCWFVAKSFDWPRLLPARTGIGPDFS